MDEESTNLTWRPLTIGDAKASADLLKAMEAADRTGEHYDEEDTLQELVDPYADLERASLAAFDGDVMVGYTKAVYKPTAEGTHRVMVDGGVHPDYRRQGIGTVLLKAGTAGAKALHALHHPTLKLVVEAQQCEHIPGAAELFRSQGFAPARYYQSMEHPLRGEIPDTAIPDGLRVEPWSEQNDEEFRMIRNEAFKDHWGTVPVPADTWKNKITNHSFRPEVSFLLRDVANGAPAGMLVTMSWDADTAATGVREAYFMLIGTLREYRRRGVAGGLIGHALRRAADQGYGKASLSVDSANPSGAFGIYEKAGFEPKDRYVRWALDVR
ncbi:GNAT family N-acetyltransferase [Streptomyces sp. MI02-7b]|uniref:GNAT family N-acetyltransferase n=1 Tax=Streptomyces sp. MI02-7b TaxID=462941 RepID=UPI0029BF9856|nr:GNAT family N-acetyltransferase [Streptomyces sp. MI02-7b]MDX3072976.1 GNAT family N-acetyltransferase [Streptomyces sp. MI02-7b]